MKIVSSNGWILAATTNALCARRHGDLIVVKNQSRRPPSMTRAAELRFGNLARVTPQ